MKLKPLINRKIVLSYMYRQIFNFYTKPKFFINSKIVRYGSSYGGWFLDLCASPQKCFLVSAGLGEDASFDIEFVSNFGTFAILIDPTPRAIEHYREIMKCAGSPNVLPYSNSGKQKIQSYNLSNIHSNNLLLEECALWSESGLVTFYEPENERNVSYSIKRPNSRGNSITVKSKSLQEIMLNFCEYIFGLEMILKLDIEGAEIQVIESIIKSGLRPRQLLVEWDFMREISILDLLRFVRLKIKLGRLGYQVVARENLNTLFVRSTTM